MTFAFEAPPDLETVIELQDSACVGDFEAKFEGIDFEALGINPSTATVAKPGSEEKVLILAARYTAGLPLWHEEDCYDHGPGRRFNGKEDFDD